MELESGSEGQQQQYNPRKIHHDGASVVMLGMASSNP